MKNIFYSPIKFSGKDHDFLFWGCTHFKHDPKWNVPIWKVRGHDSSADHDKSIISNWNSKAHSETTGFLLGDTVFGYEGDKTMLSLFHSLTFKELYVLPGNHTAGYKQLIETTEDGILDLGHKKVIFVPNYFEIVVNGRAIILCHYPILSWNGAAKGAWHLHAHVHGNLDRSEIGKLYLSSGLSYEVSVEVNPFPLTFSEIRSIMNKKSQSVPDHHE